MVRKWQIDLMPAKRPADPGSRNIAQPPCGCADNENKGFADDAGKSRYRSLGEEQKEQTASYLSRLFLYE